VLSRQLNRTCMKVDLSLSACSKLLARTHNDEVPPSSLAVVSGVDPVGYRKLAPGDMVQNLVVVKGEAAVFLIHLHLLHGSGRP
jgi:hypothetical protein